MQKSVCENCGASFLSYPSEKRRFCDRKCYGKWRKGKSFEEIYGIEEAREIRKKIGEKNHKVLKGQKCPWLEGDRNPMKRPENRANVSSARTKMWKDLEFRERTIKAMIKFHQHPVIREKHRQSAFEMWQNPEYRERAIKAMSKAQNQPEVRAKHSSVLTKLWKDSEYQRMMAKACNIKPNGLEIEFTHLLRELCPNEWEYVGDFKFFVGTKNPDFKHTSEKKLIELFGDHWHDKEEFPKTETQEERISHFKKFGYECLVVWESEFQKDLEKVKMKVLEFTARMLNCPDSIKVEATK